MFVFFSLSLVGHTCQPLLRRAPKARLRLSPLRKELFAFLNKISLYHFGSTIKHSCQRIYGEKEFSRNFYNLWQLHVNRHCSTPSKHDQVIFAAEDASHVAILTFIKSHFSIRQIVTVFGIRKLIG